MQLKKAEITHMIHNVLSYDFDDAGRLHFRRFTESQRESYAKESANWLVRANASASVTFDFIGDSEYVSLKMDMYPGSSRNWASFDLYVDGIFRQHKKVDSASCKLISFSLPEGEHRVTLYFPWTVETVVNEIHLSEGAIIRAVPKRARIIALGDSITQGYDTEYTSLTYANQVSRDLDIELINQGIGGYYFGEDSINASLVSYHPDFIVIAYGTNDYARHDDKLAFEMAATKYIEKLTSLFPSTKMLAVLPIYRNDQNNQARETYRDYTLEDARRILDRIYKKYPNISVLEETGIPRIPEVFISDYLHPNALGFTFMAKAIGEEIKKWL